VVRSPRLYSSFIKELLCRFAAMHTPPRVSAPKQRSSLSIDAADPNVIASRYAMPLPHYCYAFASAMPL
jgi:hypothetical protein